MIDEVEEGCFNINEVRFAIDQSSDHKDSTTGNNGDAMDMEISWTHGPGPSKNHPQLFSGNSSEERARASQLYVTRNKDGGVTRREHSSQKQKKGELFDDVNSLLLDSEMIDEVEEGCFNINEVRFAIDQSSDHKDSTTGNNGDAMDS
ncbi:unnamed protein product [Ilex paraguariensis]|uniref:Uncharacterized protein n=1 Tax=Ilex paraguariensis TaxID=185542 RepID=A0ABC8RPS2_9AQUA